MGGTLICFFYSIHERNEFHDPFSCHCKVGLKRVWMSSHRRPYRG